MIARLSIFFLLFANISFGQKDSTVHENFISINLTELFASDIRLSYEYKFHPKQSFKIDIGYKIPLLKYNPGPFKDLNLNPYVFKGINVALGYNYILGFSSDVRQYYFSTRICYNYNYCKNIVIVEGEDGSYGYCLIDARKILKKFDLTFGRRSLKPINTKGNLMKFFEWYVGCGIKEMNGTLKTYGTATGNDATPSAAGIKFNYLSKPIINPFDKIYFDVCIGVKVGIAWRKR